MKKSIFVVASAISLAAQSANAVDWEVSSALIANDTSVESCSGDCAGIVRDPNAVVGASVSGYADLGVIGLGGMVSFSNGLGAFVSIRAPIGPVSLSAGAGKQFQDVSLGVTTASAVRAVDSDTYADAYFAQASYGGFFARYMVYSADHSVMARDTFNGPAFVADYEIQSEEAWVGYSFSF